MSEKVREIFNAEAKAITKVLVSKYFQEAVNIIHRQVHKINGKLVTSGMGKAGQIAMKIATTFSSTGTPAAFLHPSEAQHGDLGILQKDDGYLGIKSREISEKK